MEINSNDNTINIDAYVNNIDDKQKAKNTSDNAEKNVAKTDTVNISDAAKEIQEVRKELDNIPYVRADKVEQLKNQIENGTYEIKSEEIAEKMLKDSLLNDLF
ncbi:MAG: flagellar biosynthesis anti-sigma factor FlgM [Deltaproteobacteria bacterium]|nr:flagellar biosynthesis anti-sigma factor FlgM [Deltaproteobacteria bacterium]